MKKTALSYIVFALISLPLFLLAQETEKEVHALAKEAIHLMEDGKFIESRLLLEKAKKMDSLNYIYDYEIAFSYHLQKENKKGIEILEEMFITYDSTSDQVYQLLGSLYDIEGNPDKAIKIYEDGLDIYPNAGNLYLELGVVYSFGKEDLEKGLEVWEKGIEVDPDHSSNYYWASKVFCKATDEKVWGLIYGEIFMNLERNSKRTAEISQLLHDTYRDNIEIKSKKKMEVHLASSTIRINPADTAAMESFKLPFGLIYETHITTALAAYSISHKMKKKQKLNAVALSELRSLTLEQWFKGGMAEEYPNDLFSWQQELKDKGYFKAYNMWLFLKGDEEVFGTWLAQNRNSFNTFIEWFQENPMPVSDDFRVYRNQY